MLLLPMGGAISASASDPSVSQTVSTVGLSISEFCSISHHQPCLSPAPESIGAPGPTFSTDVVVSIIFSKDIFYVYECFVCMRVYHVCVVPVEARRGVWSPGAMVIGGCELPDVGDTS